MTVAIFFLLPPPHLLFLLRGSTNSTYHPVVWADTGDAKANNRNGLFASKEVTFNHL